MWSFLSCIAPEYKRGNDEIGGIFAEGKRSLGRPRRRLVGNIKMDLRETGWDVDWIDVGQDRDRWSALVCRLMNFWVP
jgi:hypothetical protein